ncbi:probable cysteine protease RDL3 [Eutrema salsugineum]|uniref:probable cysteine protease RDL3 n=1 Tax=Eutrema salsugineum TaxID=72664 RepID=UPI000CECEEAF|nr:probable cysteine protease RDL3 [Eutrema salsugineum]
MLPRRAPATNRVIQDESPEASIGSMNGTNAEQEPRVADPVGVADEVWPMYEQWLVENGKNYNGLGEKERRFKVFKDNFKYIQEHNSVPDKTYKLGLNMFADLTNDEFQAIYCGEKMERSSVSSGEGERCQYEEGDILPDEVNGRKEGAALP